MFRRRDSNLHFLLTLLSGVAIGFILASSFLSLTSELSLCEELIQSLHKPTVVEKSANRVGAIEVQNRTIADQNFEKVRILCWILTAPENHEAKAQHVKATWGKRCNKLLFMSSEKDESLPSVALPISEGRDNLWGKTKHAFQYIYNNHLYEADWFLKADDDSFVVLENLRFMLLAYSPSEPIYFGHKFKPFVNQGYMSGGAGYVLSKEAVRRFVEVALKNSSGCSDPDDAGPEDIEIGQCLEFVNITAGDSRDYKERERFLPFHPDSLLVKGYLEKDFWFWNYTFYKFHEGIDCCSDHAISFHYVSPSDMYVFEYLIYRLRPHGISYSLQEFIKLAD